MALSNKKCTFAVVKVHKHRIETMNTLYLLQFGSLIFMVINAVLLVMSRLHVRWENKRYERSRWYIFIAFVMLAFQYIAQMLGNVRASGDDLGAIVNMLIYTPSFALISYGIYNIEATHPRRRHMVIVSTMLCTAIYLTFLIGYLHSGSQHIGWWLYVMLLFYAASVVYDVVMISREMKKRKKMLETMAANDILPYVRYSRVSLILLFLAALVMPLAILSTTLLIIVGPVVLCAVLFFTLTFISLGINYVPTEALLDEEAERIVAQRYAKTRNGGASSETSFEAEASVDATTEDGNLASEPSLTDERKAIIEEKLKQWCLGNGYKDSTVNMLTLSDNIDITRAELTLYFDKCLDTTFRIWLANIRFEAAKTMMRQFPEYSNDIISAECGFSSRTYLYRIFKEKTSKTPTEWRTGVSTS